MTRSSFVILILVMLTPLAKADIEQAFVNAFSIHLSTTCANTEYLSCVESGSQECLNELGQAIQQCRNDYQADFPSVLNSEESFTYLQKVRECSLVKQFEMAIERTGKPNLCGLEE